MVGDPAEAVPSFLRPGSEGVPVRKGLSPYGAVFPDGSSEGPDAALGLSSICCHAAAFGKRRPQAGEGSVHAYGLWPTLPRDGGDVEDGVAARADVPQHVLHRVRGLRLITLVQPLPLAGAQRGLAIRRRRLLPVCRRRESLMGNRRNQMGGTQATETGGANPATHFQD